jgi:hypothetical protein
MSREQFDRLVEEPEPCRRILAEAEREKRKGINRRGYNPDDPGRCRRGRSA